MLRRVIYVAEDTFIIPWILFQGAGFWSITLYLTALLPLSWQLKSHTVGSATIATTKWCFILTPWISSEHTWLILNWDFIVVSLRGVRSTWPQPLTALVKLLFSSSAVKQIFSPKPVDPSLDWKETIHTSHRTAADGEKKKMFMKSTNGGMRGCVPWMNFLLLSSPNITGRLILFGLGGNAMTSSTILSLETGRSLSVRLNSHTMNTDKLRWSQFREKI